MHVLSLPSKQISKCLLHTVPLLYFVPSFTPLTLLFFFLMAGAGELDSPPDKPILPHHGMVFGMSNLLGPKKKKESICSWENSISILKVC